MLQNFTHNLFADIYFDVIDWTNRAVDCKIKGDATGAVKRPAKDVSVSSLILQIEVYLHKPFKVKVTFRVVRAFVPLK